MPFQHDRHIDKARLYCRRLRFDNKILVDDNHKANAMSRAIGRHCGNAPNKARDR